MDRHSRREFLHAVGSLGLSAGGVALLAGCGALPPAAPQKPLPRIGFLSVPPSGSSPVFEALRQGLRDLGYVEGQNIVIEWRGAEGKDDQLPSLAAELVSLKVDAIVAETWPAIVAAKEATSTIPIVMAVSSDPVQTGLVASLAHPGGNITGLTTLSTGLSQKRLELLKEVVPQLSRMGLIWASVAAPDKAPGVRETQVAARALNVEIEYVEIHVADDWEAAVGTVSRAGVEGLIQLCDPVTLSRRNALVNFAAKSRLPSMYETREYVDEGGLMAYGASLTAMGRQSAIYVDKILKGAGPADLPVEQPTRFDFMVNLKTARALGLTLPQEVLIQATEVIQ
jgi:putative ABC transport system substrate-binding protein